MIRRRIMMLAQQTGSGAKYPLVNGTKIFDKAILETTNGNHVKFSLTNGNYEAYINISDINENTSTIGLPSNTKNTSEKFALKRGDVVEYRLKNIIRTDGGNGLGTISCAIYSTSGTNIGIKIQNVVTTDEMTASKTIDADVSAGCMMFYMYQPKAGETLEFDVEFLVNGERYV